MFTLKNQQKAPERNQLKRQPPAGWERLDGQVDDLDAEEKSPSVMPLSRKVFPDPLQTFAPPRES